MTDESVIRQRQRDAEYLAACKAHGIEPEPPRYIGDQQAVELEAIDRATADHGARHNGSSYRTRTDDPEPLKDLGPDGEAAARVIDLLVPVKACAREFVQTAGRRCLALAWMLGRRPEPLSELARQLGVSRASLSTYVRNLEDRTGLHGRGQKGRSTIKTYRENARKSWKLRRINRLMAEAVAE